MRCTYEIRVFIRAARAPKAPAPQNDVAITSRARVQINEYNPVTNLVLTKYFTILTTAHTFRRDHKKVHKIKTSFPSPFS